MEFRDERLCFLVHTLELKVLKFCAPPKNLFMPPQSRYPGVGPGPRPMTDFSRTDPLEAIRTGMVKAKHTIFLNYDWHILNILQGESLYDITF